MSDGQFLRHDSSSNPIADPDVFRPRPLPPGISDHIRVTANFAMKGPRPWIDVRAFNVKGDGKNLSGLSITASQTTLTGPTDMFSTAVAGMRIVVAGAGPGTQATDLVTTIATVISGTQVTLADAAARTVSNSTGFFGSNDRDEIKNAIDFAIEKRASLFFPEGIYYVEMTTAVNKIDVTGNLTIVGAGPGVATIRVGPDYPERFGFGLNSIFTFLDIATDRNVNLDISNISIQGPAMDFNVAFADQVSSNCLLYQTFGASGIKGVIRLKNVRCPSGFFQFASAFSDGTLTGSAAWLEVDSCDLKCSLQCIVWFGGNGNDKRVHAYNSRFEAGSTAGNGNIFYIHQGISLLVDGCIFENNHRAALKYAGTASTGAGKYGIISNCAFVNCTHTGVELDKFGTTIVEGCRFGVGLASGILIFGRAEIRNCVFEGGKAIVGSGVGGSYDIYVNVSDCKFDACTHIIEGGWDGAVWRFLGCQFINTNGSTSPLFMTAKDERIEIINCYFKPISTLAAVSISFGGTWLIDHCTFFGSYTRGCIEATALPATEVVVNCCDFRQSSGGAFNVSIGTELPRRIRGRDNYFGGTLLTGGNPNIGVQDIALRQAISQSTVTAAASVDLNSNFDTFHVTGTATINTLRIVDQYATKMFAGSRVYLIADNDPGFALGNSGNIKPKSSGTAQKGSAVLVYDPAAGYWYEA